MPKKTKKQKIIAAYRKKIQLLSTLTLGKQSLEPAASPLPSQPDATIKEIDTNISNEVFTYFKSDLKKSLGLSFLIIALEIIFYFATINNYLRLF